MEDIINSIKQLVWEYPDVILNTEFVVEFLEVILKNSLMTFVGEYFQQILGVIIVMNVAPILANIYMAKLENFLQKNRKTIWPVFLKRFIDDGFGIIKANTEEFEFWFKNSICLEKQ